MLLRQQGPLLIVHAPAKLNLFLEVLGKRTDGFHEIETLMISVNLYDTLSFKDGSSRKVQLRCFDVGSVCETAAAEVGSLASGRNNLVVQAAYLLRKYTGIERGARINLLKRIPVAAGLAGGSSDAAATLVALNRLWNLKLSLTELQQLALQLGSDVGFFLTGSSSAICRGRGELIEPLRLPLGVHFVIARPKTGLSTAIVYGHCRPRRYPKGADRLVDALKHGHLGQAVRFLHNSLQPPAEQLNVDVKKLRSAFSRQPVLGHMMSGSGSAYFGMCANSRQALKVAARLRSMGINHVSTAQSGP